MAATTATVIAAGASAYGATQGQKSVKKNKLPPWLNAGSKFAVERGRELATRPYEAYGGERVAGLSRDERMAGRLARGFGDELQPYMDRLSGGFSRKALSQYENPYIDQVLGNQQRVIGEEFGRQQTDLSRRQSAMDAFRTGRSDLARSRLNDSRITALGDAEATGRAGAFDRAMAAFQSQQQMDLGALGAIGQNQLGQIGALSRTGATERGIRQAGMDFDYGQFLEGRDWDYRNFGALLNALQAARGDTTQTSSGGGANKWEAYGGLLSSMLGAYSGGSYNSGANVSYVGGALGAPSVTI